MICDDASPSQIFRPSFLSAVAQTMDADEGPNTRGTEHAVGLGREASTVTA